MPDGKLIIFNIDGTKTEVEPMKLWRPNKKCMFKNRHGTCPKDATTYYSLADGVDIPLCETHYSIYSKLAEN